MLERLVNGLEVWYESVLHDQLTLICYEQTHDC